MMAATVVMLPGLLCDEAVWRSQMCSMPDAQCVVADYGGLSSIAAMARHVLDQLGGERLCVLGHSMGGRVALEMVRLAPERIERIALLDTGYRARASGAAGQAEEEGRFALLKLARARGMSEMGRQWARGMVHPARVDGPVFEAIVSMIARKSPEVFEAQIRALLDRPDARPVLAALRSPALLLCGRQDAWSPLARHQEMHELVPGSEMAVIEEAGHMTTMEQPAAVNTCLRRWIDG